MAQVLYLPMDADFDDDSPSGHVVTPTADGLAPTLSANPPTIDTTTKKYGAGSGKFVKASSQRAAFTDSPYWTMADSNFTVRGWFNWTTHTADACLVAQASSLASRQLFLYYWSAGQLGFYVYTESAARAYYYVAFTPTNGQWYHIQVSRNGSSILLFIDGVSQTLTEVNAIGTYSIPNINGTMGIGYQPSQAQYFNGHIDDLEIAKDICRDTSNFTPPAGAIVPDEYTRLYMPMDADFNSSYLPLIDTSIKEVGAGSGQFVSPFGDYLSIADSDDFYFADNDFDITGYFYLRSHPIIDGNYDYFFYILGQTEDINNRWNITYQESGGKSYITIFTKDSGITRADIAGDMGVLATLDHWYKFKCSRVGSNLLVYIDDVLLALTGTDIGTKSFADLATPLQIAKDALTSYPHYFDGHLDDIEIKGVAGQALTKSLSDSISFTENISKDFSKPVSQSFTLSDSLHKIYNNIKYDTIPLIGRLYYRRPIGEEHRESFDFNDSTSKKVAKVVIDDINFSDVFVSLWTRLLALFDLHVLSDNMSYIWQSKKSIQEQIDFIETHGVYFEKRLFTNFNLIDIVSAYIPPKFYLFIADKLGASSSLVKFFNKSLNDIGSLNEIKEFVIGKNFSDYFNLHDMRFLVSTLIRNIYDSLPLSDIVNKLYKKGDTDSVGLYDTKTITTIKSITDNIPLSDVIHYLSNFVKNISDGLSLTDSFSMIWDVVRSIDESFGLIDSRSNRIKQSNVESISLSDIDIKKDIGKNISELPLSLVDTVSTAWAVLRSIGESLTLSDLNFFSIKKPVDDSVGIQDFFLYVRGRYLALADLQVLVDNVAKGVFQSQQEHIDFIDYHGVYFEKRTLDNFNLHDVFTAYMQGFLSISEGVGITDKIKKFTNKLLLDAESLIDNVTKKYGKNLYDYISLDDSTLLYMNNTYYISLFNRIDLYDAIAKRIILYKDDSLSLVAELLSDGYLAIQDSISLTDHLSMKVMKVLGEIIPITDDITQLLESEPFYFDKGVVEPYFVIEDLRVYGGAEMHFYPDQTVVAKWKTRYFVNDLLFDPDSHTITVYDPKGQIRVVYNSAYLVKDSIGVYKYTFNLPTDVVGGDWYIRIKGTKGTWNSILNIHLEVRKK